MSYLPHQERMMEEFTELHDRLNKLTAFIASPRYMELDQDERLDLLEQSDHMRKYRNVLEKRIHKFLE